MRPLQMLRTEPTFELPSLRMYEYGIQCFEAGMTLAETLEGLDPNAAMNASDGYQSAEEGSI